MLPPAENLSPTSKSILNHVTFDDYLQPKKTLHKQTKLLKFDEEERNQLKSEELMADESPIKLQQLKEQLNQKINRNKNKNQNQNQNPNFNLNNNNNNIYINKTENDLHNDKVFVNKKWQHLHFGSSFRLPRFLAFLRARKDDGLCKRKTGFEIYCEMASIHGFVNFVGAKTWERIFWCLVIVGAVFMSVVVLVMSHYLNVGTPITMVTESTYHPAWTIPFPAVTICNLNRISRAKSEALTDQFLSSSNVTRSDLVQLFRLSLFESTENNATQRKEFRLLQKLLECNNFTLERLRDEISPDCSEQLLRCKWQGRLQRCEKFFQTVDTPQGKCCAFNSLLAARGVEKRSSSAISKANTPLWTNSCGYKSGLTVLLDPHLEDYGATGLIWMPGYQVLVHDALDFAADSVERQFVQMRTETSLNVVPQNTYGTDYLRKESISVRRCYFPEERRLSHFANYTQTNCLTECRSRMMVQKCGCSPAWSRLGHGNASEVCSLEQAACVAQHKDVFHSLLIDEMNQRSYKEDRYAEAFICGCFPRCGFNKYSTVMEAATLNRSYSFGDKRFFKNISIRNHVLLHVFYGDLIAQKFRLDVYENWLSFVSTFGGIAGLHMGYSFVSGFEMIFFVFVRPLCNWLTKKQIRYRNQRKQRVVAATTKAFEQERPNGEVIKEVPTKVDINSNA